MKRWNLLAVVAVASAAMVACNERPTVAPSAPVADIAALTTVPACDLSGTNPLVSHYFSAEEAKVVRGLLSQITAAGAGSPTARDRGFDVFARIAANAAAGTGGPAQDASDLMNAVSVCMFTDPAQLPANFPEDYTVAVATAQPGGIGVRGSASDPTYDAVVSRNLFSGIAPPAGVTWATMLGGTRLLAYGRPGAPNHYDWKVLPRNATFSPQAVVGVCVDVNAAPTSMLAEEHVGLLTFADAYFLDPLSCDTFTSRSSWSERLAALFLPKPLNAGTLKTGGIGGSTGGIGSDFGPLEVPAVNLTFTVQPPTSVAVGTPFTVEVRATDPASGSTVGGVRISVLAENNNGVPKQLGGTTTRTTGNSGVATFQLTFPAGSTGGYRLVASGGVNGRDAISVVQATSTKVNAKPAK